MSVRKTQIANQKWFNSLPETKQEALRAQYQSFKGNIRSKELDLSIDGVAGSSTKFLIAARSKLIELKADKPVHSEPKVPDIAKGAVEFADGQKLAAILNNNGVKTSDGENFSCQACIAMESDKPEKVKEISATIAKHGTPEQFSQVLRIYSSKPENLALAKAQWVAKPLETNEFKQAAASLQTCDVSTPDQNRFSFSGIGVVAAGVSGGQEQSFLLGQAAAKIKLWEDEKIGDVTANIAASRRPSFKDGAYSDPQIFLLDANISAKKNNWELQGGIVNNIGNTLYRKPLDSTSALPCGCLLDKAADSTPANDGPFEPRLNETVLAGLKLEHKTQKSATSIMAGYSTQSDVLPIHKTTVVASHEHKINDKTTVSANVAYQPEDNKYSANAGVKRKIGKNSEVGLGAYANDGIRGKEAGIEARLKKEITPNDTLTIKPYFERNFDRNEDRYGVAAGYNHKTKNGNIIGTLVDVNDKEQSGFVTFSIPWGGSKKKDRLVD